MEINVLPCALFKHSSSIPTSFDIIHTMWPGPWGTHLPEQNLSRKRLCLQGLVMVINSGKPRKRTDVGMTLFDIILCGTLCLVVPGMFPSRNVLDGRHVSDGPLIPCLTWAKGQEGAGGGRELGRPQVPHWSSFLLSGDLSLYLPSPASSIHSGFCAQHLFWGPQGQWHACSFQILPQISRWWGKGAYRTRYP